MTLTSLCHMVNELRIANDYRYVGQVGWITFITVWGIPAALSGPLMFVNYYGQIDHAGHSIKLQFSASRGVFLDEDTLTLSPNLRETKLT